VPPQHAPFLAHPRTGLMTPIFTIDGREVFLNPFDLTPVPVERLGPVVASFAQDEDARHRTQKALDEVLSPC
jgi:hypothetical protein